MELIGRASTLTLLFLMLMMKWIKYLASVPHLTSASACSCLQYVHITANIMVSSLYTMKMSLPNHQH